jgi:hypothetical protein
LGQLGQLAQLAELVQLAQLGQLVQLVDLILVDGRLKVISKPLFSVTLSAAKGLSI